MSGFSKLDKYKGAVKAVTKKVTEESTPEILPEKNERKTVIQEITQVIQQNPEPQPQEVAVPIKKEAPTPVPPPKVEESLNPFNEADSERNIIFLDKAEVNKLIAESNEKEKEPGNDIPQIKGASLVKLIERATSEKYADPTFQSDFLLTYRSFTNPRAVLNLLIKRFNAPIPKDLSYGELQEWKQNTQKPIRLRVINMLRNWIDKHWKDITDDVEVTTALIQFLMEDMNQQGYQTSADSLSKALDKKRQNPETEREVVFSEQPPKPILPNLKNKSSSQLSLLDFSSEELARQMTLIEYNLYKAIKPWEFFNQGWTKKNKEINSPNVLKLIARFNEVSRWVSTEIVRAEPLKQRIQVLAKFLELAEKCKQYNNFNALMEILSGLNSSAVYRLKQTWNGLSKRERESYEEIKDLMSRTNNYAQLRKVFKQCNPPLIPYLGLYLTDLTFIEDGNPDLIEGGLINWVKRRRLANAIKDIQQYQFKPYCLEEVSFIQEYLLSYPTLDDDQAYKLSLQRETRTAESSDEPDKREKEKDKKEKSGSLFGFRKSAKDIPSPASTPKDIKNSGGKAVANKQEPEHEEEEEFEIQYREGYKFYDKDSEHNIILEKDPKGEANDVIIAGTLPKLVERLTYEKYPDMNYTLSFLLTYRTFMTANELLDLLNMRYYMPPPVNNSPDVSEKFRQQKETPVQLRVLNVCKSWVDKHFEDFKDDKALLTRFVEFIDKAMIPSPMLSRGGQNLKAQISNKLEAKEEKKAYQFDKSPPTPILPNVAQPGLLDYNPEEVARQFTLLDYDLLTSIKPIEYLSLVKPSSWMMDSEDQAEEDPQNVKGSPHVVQVIYRFTDVRDWVSTQVVKCTTKEQRAKILEHFISIADNCLQLKNFNTLFSIMASLNSIYIQKLISTWKLLSPTSLETFVRLRDLVSYRQNFKALRERMGKVDMPAIPYIGMYIQDIANFKEQMPDTLEPGSLINFGKRQKMAEQINNVNTFCQQPYCLQPVEMLQSFLKDLEIYEKSDILQLVEEFIDQDGDRDSTEDIFSSVERKVSGGKQTIPANPLRTSTPGGSPRGSPSPSVSSGLNSPEPIREAEPVKVEPTPAVTNSPTTNRSTPIPPMKPTPARVGSSANIAHTAAPSVPAPAPVVQEVNPLNSILQKQYPGATVSDWKVMDNGGVVYPWGGEEVIAKVVTKNAAESFLVPLLLNGTSNPTIDKPELALLMRINSFYEQSTRQRIKLIVFASSITDGAKAVITKQSIQTLSQ